MDYILLSLVSFILAFDVDRIYAFLLDHIVEFRDIFFTDVLPLVQLFVDVSTYFLEELFGLFSRFKVATAIQGTYVGQFIV